MELDIHRDLVVGGQYVSTGGGYPYVPTAVELDIAFGGDRVIQQPEPARMTARLWVPDSHAATHRPTVGGLVDILVTDGDRTSHVFGGRVDKITRRRRPSRAAGAEPLPLPRIAANQLVKITWSLGGEDLYIGWSRRPDDLSFEAPVADDLVNPDWPGYITGRIDLAEHASPRSWLWASGEPRAPFSEPYYGGDPSPPQLLDPDVDPWESLNRWWWRMNGQLMPVTDGPVMIGDTVPSDLALVTWVWGGEYSARLAPPVSRPLTSSAGKSLPPGEWLTVTASDHLATLARHKIGAAPWGEETVNSRMQAVARAVRDRGVPAVISLGWPSGIPGVSFVKVAGRDVDNQPALSLLTEAYGAVGAIATSSRLVSADLPVEQPRSLGDDGSVGVNPSTLVLPPYVVPELPLSTSSTDLVNKIRVGYLDTSGAEPVERTVELVDGGSVREWGEAAARISTSVVAPTGDPDTSSTLGPVLDRLRNALPTLATPTYRFDVPIALTPGLLHRLPAGTDLVRALADHNRHGRPVEIPHGVDGLPTSFTLRGGSIVSDRGSLAVTLELEPAGESGAPTLTYLALVTAANPVTYEQLDPTLTYTDTAALDAG